VNARFSHQGAAPSPRAPMLPDDGAKSGGRPTCPDGRSPSGRAVAVPAEPASQSSALRASIPNALVTADASEMSGLAFMDATGMSSPEKRAERIHRDRQACIRAIRAGDTRGFPPMFVADCRRIMAEQPDFDQVDWVQAVRSAYAMPKGGAL
jgi:hypothetical protein